MKKAILSGIITIIIVISTVSCVFADEGDAETPATVAPAIIQAPPASEKPVAAQAPCPVAPSRPTRVRADTALRECEPEYMVGSVSCIVPSGIMQPTSKIFVADQDGSAIEFSVKPLAVIYDGTGAFLSLDRLQPGTRVRVSYKTLCANNRVATAIKVLK